MSSSHGSSGLRTETPATDDVHAAVGASASTARVIGVIPARLASTRLPRKMLQPVLGRPLLAWVVEAAQRCPQLQQVIVAVDADETAALCDREGWRWQMTDPELPSGTDRMRAVAERVSADIYVNVQGDEPLLEPAHIAALLRPFARGPRVEVTTVATPCTLENVNNPNAVKVVTGADGRALYFSRAAIPYDRDAAGAAYWKHLGLYAYRRDALLRFSALPPGRLEQIEKLEQLRLLENNIGLYVEQVEFDTVGVDTIDDVPRVESLLRSRVATSLP